MYFQINDIFFYIIKRKNAILSKALKVPKKIM